MVIQPLLQDLDGVLGQVAATLATGSSRGGRGGGRGGRPQRPAAVSGATHDVSVSAVLAAGVFVRGGAGVALTNWKQGEERFNLATSVKFQCAWKSIESCLLHNCSRQLLNPPNQSKLINQQQCEQMFSFSTTMENSLIAQLLLLMQHSSSVSSCWKLPENIFSLLRVGDFYITQWRDATRSRKRPLHCLIMSHNHQ